MNSQNSSVKNMCSSLLLVVSGLTFSAAQAEEVLPAKLQSDAQINVWVNNSSLSLFVSQLAMMTGRDAAIVGDLEGQVSGRFDGSMVDALGSVSQQFPVLFDIDDQTIGAVPADERSSATIALGDTEIDDEMSSLLAANQLSGNTVEVRGGELVVSGHPSFVARTTDSVNRVLASSNGQPMPSEAVPANAVVDNNVESESLVQVSDAAAQVILDEASEEGSSVNATEAASVSRRPVRWVTDIDGFDTF